MRLSDVTELKVEEVTKKFGSLIALKGCSLQINSSGIFGLIGANGSGKTTLFNIISGFSRPDSGRVVYAGRNIISKSPVEISRMGLVRTFQLPRIFPSLTVLENLEATRPLSSKKETIDELLSLVNLKEVRNQLGSSLSYGQKKQLDIARAMILDPRILMLDEPTAGLEPALIKTMMEEIKYIRDLKKGVFVIEHNMNVLMNLAEKIIVLHNGLKIAEGTPSSIQSDEMVIDAYLGETL